MKRKLSPVSAFTRPQILDYGERGALFLTIVSGAAAIVQSSALQLAAPAMSLSLLLGYFNRRQMHQGLLSHMVSLRSDVQQLERHQVWGGEPASFNDFSRVEAQVSQLQNQHEGIHHAVTEMLQQVSSTTPSEHHWESLQQSFGQLSDRVEALQNALSGDSHSSVALQISQAQAAQHNMGVQLQMQLEEVQYEIGTLKSSVEALAKIPTSEPSTLLVQESESTGFHAIAQALDQLKGQVESLAEQIHVIEEPTVPAEGAIDVVVLAETVKSLQSHVETWETRFEQHRINLKQGLGAMPQMVEQSIEDYQRLHPVEVGVKSEELYALQRHVQQQIAALGAKLEQVILRFSRDIKGLAIQVQTVTQQATGTHGMYKPVSGNLTPERLTTATPLSVRSALESQDAGKRGAVATVSLPQTLASVPEPPKQTSIPVPSDAIPPIAQDASSTPTFPGSTQSDGAAPNWDSMLDELKE